MTAGLVQVALGMAIIAIVASSEFTSTPEDMKKKLQTTNMKIPIASSWVI